MPQAGREPTTTKNNMNWGRIIGWAIVALSAASSVGYLMAGNYRQALYFFFAAAITAVVNWP